MAALAAAALASGSACAMSQPSVEPACVVTGGDKLPPEAGGIGGLCNAIMAAIARQPADLPATVDVRVLSASSLSARVTLADGRVLPEQRMAVNDRQLNRSSIERFAGAIAAEIARAGGR
jgi:hypothetical protein